MTHPARLVFTALALACCLSVTGTAALAADEAPPLITNDLDLQPALERRREATWRLYRAVHRAVHRRQWAGAAAAAIEQAERAAEVRSPHLARDTPTAGPMPSLGGVWDQLAECEASGDWSANTGNGYYGGLQFTISTWHAYGGAGLPHHASREQQIDVATRTRAGQGWGAWPACSRKLGLR